MAKATGLSRQTVSAFERGRSNFQRETLDILSAHFGLTAEDVESRVVVRPLPPPPPARRAADQELPPEYVALARRIMRLTPSAFTCLLVLIGHFEMEMTQHRESDGPPPLGHSPHPEVTFSQSV